MSDSEYAYTYDNLGRVLTTSNSGTPGVPTVVLTSAYNANSQRTSLAASVDSTADFLNSYSYDNLNRQTRVDQTGNGGATVANKRVDFEYNAIGQFTEITRHYKPSSTWLEAVTSTYTYDTLNRITALDHTHSTTNIANYDFTYDFMNRMSQFSGPDGTSDFTYDKTSQVTATNHSYQTDESNTYDSTGNRTNGRYTVGTNNRMTSDGTYNYTYDNEGNRLTRTKISNDYVTTYEWDHRNRLIGVTETDDMATVLSSVEYAYDPFDRRLAKMIDADGAGMNDPIEVHYIYFGDNIVLQFDEDDVLTHRYLHGPAIDQILADENAANEVHWPLPDHQGTIRDIAENDGDVLNHIEYGTFGNITAETNAAIDLIYGYTGRENDEETGQMHYRTRPYDPATGKFTGEDRSGFRARDPNLSRYVANSAPNFTDPYGLEAGSLVTISTAGTCADASKGKPTKTFPKAPPGLWPPPTAALNYKKLPLKSDPTDKSYDVVAIYDNKDANPGFANAFHLWNSANNYQTALPISSKKLMKQALAEYVAKYGKIDSLLIMDHAIKGPKQTIGNDVLEVADFADLLPYLSDDPHITLTGCTVGTNTDYCQAIADATNGTVRASSGMCFHPQSLAPMYPEFGWSFFYAEPPPIISPWNF